MGNVDTHILALDLEINFDRLIFRDETFTRRYPAWDTRPLKISETLDDRKLTKIWWGGSLKNEKNKINSQYNSSILIMINKTISITKTFN